MKTNENPWISMISLYTGKPLIRDDQNSHVTDWPQTNEKIYFPSYPENQNRTLFLMWHTIEIYFLDFCHEQLTRVTVWGWTPNSTSGPRRHHLDRKIGSVCILLLSMFSHYIIYIAKITEFFAKKSYFWGKSRVKIESHVQNQTLIQSNGEMASINTSFQLRL